jgi:hypothetical protein
VALGKLDGVTTVDVTLKRGVAHIALKPGNTVTLTQLRQTVKDAGYSSGAAVTTAIGRLSAAGRQKVLSVAGTSMTWVLEADAGTPPAASLAAMAEGTTVEVTGTIASASRGTTPDRIVIREIAAIR